MIKITSLCRAFDKEVIKDLSATLPSCGFVSVCGPSGCGKSTLLRILSGLDTNYSGSVEPSPNSLKVSMAFQEPRLLPWRTAAENVNLVIGDKKETLQRSAELLIELGFEEADLTKLPNELSGGMKSRVSLARALVYEGDLVLLDEPFAALDEALRKRLGERLKAEIKARGASAILVTHQTEDAAQLADRILTL
jgi:NitT/TauT family transport system ATP-binding protein